MSDNQVSDVLAQAFAAEGVDTLFTLMGDANMYWSASMADNQKVRLIHARHEHCCVAMADAYARATGKVGVGSVTCGPGYTQIMTALAMAARGNAPVVVFAGDAPIGASWYIQSIDQAPLALATGAHFVPIRTIGRALDCVREAFYVARAERKPVVLSVPLDLQTEEFPYLPDYVPDRLGSRFELPRQLLRCSPRSDQINHLSPEFRRIGSVTLRHRWHLLLK
jgi:acetolactate synthase I/II/III large subunit